MIPEQIRQYPLIKVCRPDCRISSHGDCDDSGKRPVRSAKADRPIPEIQQWIRQGGNYGVVARPDNRLIVLDSDSDEFARLVRKMLPDTFTVKTGSGNYHFYYRSDYSGNQSFGQGSSELGSIRTDNYQAVGPNSVHPDTGREYTVYQDNPVSPVPESQIRDFIEQINSTDFVGEDGAAAAAAGGGGGGGGSSPSVKTADQLSISPTERTLNSLGFIQLQSKRKSIAKVLDHHHPPRHIRVWACGFLYSACGLTQNQIERILRELAGWATDHGRIRTEVRSLVRTSCNNSKASELVDLDYYLNNADMDGDTSERRKTEESGKGRTLQGGDLNMVDDDVKDHVTVTNDSSRVVRSGIVEVENDGNEWEYAGILFGSMEEEEELGTVVNWEYNQYDSKNYNDIGDRSPEELRMAAEALEDLADEIED